MEAATVPAYCHHGRLEHNCPVCSTEWVYARNLKPGMEIKVNDDVWTIRTATRVRLPDSEDYLARWVVVISCGRRNIHQSRREFMRLQWEPVELA